MSTDLDEIKNFRLIAGRIAHFAAAGLSKRSGYSKNDIEMSNCWNLAIQKSVDSEIVDNSIEITNC